MTLMEKTLAGEFRKPRLLENGEEEEVEKFSSEQTDFSPMVIGVICILNYFKFTCFVFNLYKLCLTVVVAYNELFSAYAIKKRQKEKVRMAQRKVKQQLLAKNKKKRKIEEGVSEVVEEDENKDEDKEMEDGEKEEGDAVEEEAKQAERQAAVTEEKYKLVSQGYVMRALTTVASCARTGRALREVIVRAMRGDTINVRCDVSFVSPLLSFSRAVEGDFDGLHEVRLFFLYFIIYLFSREYLLICCFFFFKIFFYFILFLAFREP